MDCDLMIVVKEHASTVRIVREKFVSPQLCPPLTRERACSGNEIVHEENRILVDDNVIVHSLCNNLFYNTRKHINFDHEGDWSQFTNLWDTSGNINKIRCFFTKLCEARSFVQIRRKPPNQDRSYNHFLYVF